eukprot:5794945-Amphidinium_carterae.1
MVRIHNLAGKTWELPTIPDSTVLDLKRALFKEMGASASGGLASLLLQNGLHTLQDEQVLREHGINDGTELMLVVSAVPIGMYVMQDAEYPPAGRNTNASVSALFEVDGRAVITICEDEVTSDNEFEDYNPFLNFAAFNQRFECETELVQTNEPKRLRLRVHNANRQGRFKRPPAEELFGELIPLPEANAPSEPRWRLQLPFAAGGCND